jgi:hypothetical protein
MDKKYSNYSVISIDSLALILYFTVFLLNKTYLSTQYCSVKASTDHIKAKGIIGENMAVENMVFITVANLSSILN